MSKYRLKAEILEDGTLMLFGVIGSEFDELDASTVVKEIRGLPTDEPIRVLIQSPGGFVSDGLAIYNALRRHEARVEVEIAGVAASMASAIAMAGDRITIPENGMLMIHDPWDVAVGNATEMRKKADTLDKFADSLAGIYARRTGLPDDEIRDMMHDETWMSAEEALEKGFVDETIEPRGAEAFADIDVSELNNVPPRLVALIREGRQMARKHNNKGSDVEENGSTVTEADAGKVNGTGEGDSGGAAPRQASGEPTHEQLVQEHGTRQPEGPPAKSQRDRTVEEGAIARERKRIAEIRKIKAMFHEDIVPESVARQHEELGTSVEEFRGIVLRLASAYENTYGPQVNARITESERDKFIKGAADWLIIRSGNRALVEKAQAERGESGSKLDPGEFRGLTLLEVARESLNRSGTHTKGLSKMELAAVALGMRPRSSIVQTPSDFPILLENVLNKMLQAAYELTADTWRSFARSGSVNDFRDNPRLRLGTLGRLDDLLPSGEFRHKDFPDAEKESIKAATVGNIVGISRQAIVNDDVDGFSRIITMLGRAAMLSIEADVYDLLGLNSGLGPTMRDGNPLFDAAHGNIDSPAAAPSVDAFESARQLMAQQLDPDGNEILDLRPAVWVGPITVGGEARVVVEAEFDFGAETSGNTGQFRKPNKVRDFVEAIVDTARLSGTRWYVFADPAITPTLEVVFLDGQESPVLETQEGFDYDGIRWRVRHDFGVDATDFRPAVTNAGA